MSFLNLPPELRCEIYSYTALPREPFDTYHGLYLSCKAIKAEMDYECNRVLRSYVVGLQNDLPANSGILLSLIDADPSGVSRNLRISLSTRVFAYYPSQVIEYRSPAALQPYFKAHFESLTFTFHEDGGQLIDRFNLYWLEDRICISTMFRRREVYAKRMIMELPPLHSLGAQIWDESVEKASGYYLKCRRDWRRHDWIEHDGMIKVVWERVESKKPVVDVDRVFVLHALQGSRGHTPWTAPGWVDRDVGSITIAIFLGCLAWSLVMDIFQLVVARAD